MSTIGHRITPNDLRRHKPGRLPNDTMDAMAETLGWDVAREPDDRGYPQSEYRRGPWSLRVGWTEHNGHAVRASLFNHTTRDRLFPSRDKWVDPATGEFNPFLRSQNLFRWVGTRLYDERLT